MLWDAVSPKYGLISLCGGKVIKAKFQHFVKICSWKTGQENWWVLLFQMGTIATYWEQKVIWPPTGLGSSSILYQCCFQNSEVHNELHFCPSRMKVYRKKQVSHDFDSCQSVWKCTEKQVSHDFNSCQSVQKGFLLCGSHFFPIFSTEICNDIKTYTFSNRITWKVLAISRIVRILIMTIKMF